VAFVGRKAFTQPTLPSGKAIHSIREEDDEEEEEEVKERGRSASVFLPVSGGGDVQRFTANLTLNTSHYITGAEETR